MCQAPSSCRKNASSIDPTDRSASTQTKRRCPDGVRLKRVTRTGSESVGESHFSTNDLSDARAVSRSWSTLAPLFSYRRT